MSPPMWSGVEDEAVPYRLLGAMAPLRVPSDTRGEYAGLRTWRAGSWRIVDTCRHGERRFVARPTSGRCPRPLPTFGLLSEAAEYCFTR